MNRETWGPGWRTIQAVLLTLNNAPAEGMTCVEVAESTIYAPSTVRLAMDRAVRLGLAEAVGWRNVGPGGRPSLYRRTAVPVNVEYTR